jgi:hypothetical protein
MPPGPFALARLAYRAGNIALPQWPGRSEGGGQKKRRGTWLMPNLTG